MSVNLSILAKTKVSRTPDYKIQTDLTEDSFEMNSFINKMDYLHLQYNLKMSNLIEKIEKSVLNNNEELCSWNSLITSN
jgi:hypothetical protein